MRPTFKGQHRVVPGVGGDERIGCGTHDTRQQTPGEAALQEPSKTSPGDGGVSPARRA